MYKESVGFLLMFGVLIPGLNVTAFASNIQIPINQACIDASALTGEIEIDFETGGGDSSVDSITGKLLAFIAIRLLYSLTVTIVDAIVVNVTGSSVQEHITRAVNEAFRLYNMNLRGTASSTISCFCGWCMIPVPFNDPYVLEAY